MIITELIFKCTKAKISPVTPNLTHMSISSYEKHSLSVLKILVPVWMKYSLWMHKLNTCASFSSVSLQD